MPNIPNKAHKATSMEFVYNTMEK